MDPLLLTLIRGRRSAIGLRPVKVYPPACKPYGLEADPEGGRHDEPSDPWTLGPFVLSNVKG